jgi:hypothetical protein
LNGSLAENQEEECNRGAGQFSFQDDSKEKTKSKD